MGKYDKFFELRAGFTPLQIFEEYAIVSDPEFKTAIEEYCAEQDCEAFIDYLPERDEWVFHTLMDIRASLKWERKIAERFKAPNPPAKHQVLVAEIAQQLVLQGISFSTEFPCYGGYIDLLTDDAIYEVKSLLNTQQVNMGVGQLLHYRYYIDRPNLILAGLPCYQTEQLKPFCQSLGISIVELKGNKNGT